MIVETVDLTEVVVDLYCLLLIYFWLRLRHLIWPHSALLRCFCLHCLGLFFCAHWFGHWVHFGLNLFEFLFGIDSALLVFGYLGFRSEKLVQWVNMQVVWKFRLPGGFFLVDPHRDILSELVHININLALVQFILYVQNQIVEDFDLVVWLDEVAPLVWDWVLDADCLFDFSLMFLQDFGD